MPVQNPVLNPTGDVSLCSLEKAICNPFMGFLTVLKIVIPSLEELNKAHWRKVFLLLSQIVQMKNRKSFHSPFAPALKREGDNLFTTCTFVRVLTFAGAVSTSSGNPGGHRAAHDEGGPRGDGEGGQLCDKPAIGAGWRDDVLDTRRATCCHKGITPTDLPFSRVSRSTQKSNHSVSLHERRGIEVIIIHLSLENG